MSAQPVDVLATLRWAESELGAENLPNCAEHVCRARAAVAELIEAARELREHAQHHPDCSLTPNGIDGDCWCGFSLSAERADAALARVSGGEA